MDAGNNIEQTTPDVTEVTRANYRTRLPLIKQALTQCTFYAFDLEMTGLTLENHREEYFDEPQDRWNRVRESAGAFAITQFGLSCFKRVTGGYEASTFNAYIFPEPLPGEASNYAPSRRFLSDAESLTFLANHSFDFNKWITQGVPFMPLKWHEERLQQFNRQADRDGINGPVRKTVTIDKPEDLTFVEELVAQVHAWLAGETEVLRLGRMTSYRRLITYQELSRPRDWSKEGAGKLLPDDAQPVSSGFYLSKVDIDNWTHIMLVRGDASAAAAAEAERKAALRELLLGASGFSEVLRAMRECGKPAVGHNCMFDIAYVLSHFGDGLSLPTSWPDFKSRVAYWFPAGVYDTKYLSHSLPEKIRPDGTGLGSLYKTLEPGQPGHQAALELLSEVPSGYKRCLPTVRHAPGFNRYQGVEGDALAHEAGYDAFMTGAVAASLFHLVGAQPKEGGKASSFTHMSGRVNVMRSDMPYLALSGPDPPINRPHVLHVSGGPQGSRVSDVSAVLAAAGVPGKVRVNMLPYASSAGIGGWLVELDAQATADWTPARVSRAVAAACESGALPGGPLPEGSPAWEVQSWQDYASRKQQLLQESAGLGNGWVRTEDRKRRRVEQSDAPAQQPQATPTDDSSSGSKCSIM